MALSVRTVSGKKFRRAGIEFSRTPVIVSDEELGRPMAPPSYPKGSTVESVLKGDSSLVCLPVTEDPAPAEEKTEAPAGSNGRKK